MLARADSAAVRAKLSFEEPGQSGLQVPHQRMPIQAQRCSRKLLSTAFSLLLSSCILPTP